MLHISLAAERIGSIFGFSITNSLLMTWIVMGLLMLFALYIRSNLAMRPSGLQLVAEEMIGGLYRFFKDITGEKINAASPLLATIFFLVIFSNWMGLLPGVGSIGIREKSEEIVAEGTQETEQSVATESSEDTTHENEVTEVASTSSEGSTHGSVEERLVPILRAPTADLNLTLALALISFTSIQYFGFASLGFGYIKKFINISNPIMFFVGILELISEFAKIVSFAFRLFGNIFAGEVLLAVIAFLIPIIAPIPFLGLEVFVGFIQALVFSMLTAVFLSMASHEH